MGKSIITNKALRNKDRKPVFSEVFDGEKRVICPKCGGYCLPEELTVTEGKGSTMFRHRVDILARCIDCKTGQFLIIMPPEEGMKLALFSDVYE